MKISNLFLNLHQRSDGVMASVTYSGITDHRWETRLLLESVLLEGCDLTADPWTVLSELYSQLAMVRKASIRPPVTDQDPTA